MLQAGRVHTYLASRIRCGSIKHMRTTLDIDDDVLLAVREIAAKERKTAGKILSEFTRLGLLSGAGTSSTSQSGEAFVMKNGIPILPSRGELVTTRQIERIMEQEGI